MRILYYALFHTSDWPSGCSAIAHLIDLVAACRDYSDLEHLSVDIVVPDSAKAEEISIPGIRWISIQKLKVGPGKGLTPVPPEWYEWLQTDDDYDLIVFCFASQFLALKGALFERKQSAELLPMARPVAAVLSEPSDKYLRFPLTPWGRLSFATVPAVAPVAVFNAVDIRYLHQCLDDLLSPSLSEHAKKQITLLRPYVHAGAVESFRRNTCGVQQRTLTFLHAGTLSDRKRVYLLIEALEKARHRFPEIKLIIVTQWGEISPTFYRPWIEVILRANRDTFFRQLSRSDVFFCGAEYEGTGLSYVQMAEAGLVGIFIDAEWLKDRLPSGYPWLVPEEAKLQAYIERLCQQIRTSSGGPEDAVSRLRSHWLDMFSSRGTVTAWLSWFHHSSLQYLDRPRWRFWLDIMIITARELHPGDAYSREEIYSLMKAVVPKGSIDPKTVLRGFVFRILARSAGLVERSNGWAKLH